MNDIVFKLGNSSWILKTPNMYRSSWNCRVENLEKINTCSCRRTVNETAVKL